MRVEGELKFATEEKSTILEKSQILDRRMNESRWVSRIAYLLFDSKRNNQQDVPGKTRILFSSKNTVSFSFLALLSA